MLNGQAASIHNLLPILHSRPEPSPQIAVAVMLDGTVAVEVASQHALLQWPFMSDISMIDAIIKVFQLPPQLLDVQPNTTTELGTLQVMFMNVRAVHANSDIRL